MTKHRLFGLLTALAVVLSLFAALPEGLLRADAATTYALWVAGTQVTSSNASNVLGTTTKTVVYTPSTKTLTLSGSVAGGIGNAILSEIDGLTIKVNSNCSVTSTGDLSAVSLSENTCITGSGKLTVIAQKSSGIFVDGATLTIDNADLHVEGKWGISGFPYNEKLVIKNSTVYAKTTGNKFAVGDFKKGIELTDSAIVQPTGGYVDYETDEHGNHYGIYNKQGTLLADTVRIIPAYPLYVGGKQVTVENYSDVLGTGSKSAVYDAARNTLAINANIGCTFDDAIRNEGVSGLLINVTKDATVLSTVKSGIHCYVDTSITGTGKLTVSGSKQCGIFMEKRAKLSIYDTRVIASGNYGIAGYPSGEKLYVSNAYVSATGIDNGSAISDFNGGMTITDSLITTPEVSSNRSGTIYEYGTSSPAMFVEIKPYSEIKYDLRVKGKQVTRANASDILGTGFCEAVYDPEKNTLTLNCDFLVPDDECAVQSEIPDLTIKVNGDVCLSSENKPAFYLKADTTVTGTGKLTLTSRTDCGILSNNAALTVKDTEIDATGVYGIAGMPDNEYLIIENSTVKAGGEAAAIADFKSISLSGCRIKDPSGAVIYSGTVYLNDSLRYRAANVTIVPGLKGDVNGDGKVNMRDYALLQKYLLDPASVEIIESNADLDGNGKINMRDYAALQKLLLNQ